MEEIDKLIERVKRNPDGWYFDREVIKMLQELKDEIKSKKV